MFSKIAIEASRNVSTITAEHSLSNKDTTRKQTGKRVRKCSHLIIWNQLSASKNLIELQNLVIDLGNALGANQPFRANYENFNLGHRINIQGEGHRRVGAGPDWKITQSPMPLGCWSDGPDWSFHSLHGEVGLHLIYSHRFITSFSTTSQSPSLARTKHSSSPLTCSSCSLLENTSLSVKGQVYGWSSNDRSSNLHGCSS